jgi:hypothetical protein
MMIDNEISYDSMTSKFRKTMEVLESAQRTKVMPSNSHGTTTTAFTATTPSILAKHFLSVFSLTGLHTRMLSCSSILFSG